MYTQFHMEAQVIASNRVMKVSVELLYYLDDVCRCAICPEYIPQTLSMDTIKSLPKVYKVDIQSSLLFMTLVNDVSQGNAFCAVSTISKMVCSSLST